MRKYIPDILTNISIQMEPFVRVAKDYKLYSEAFHGSSSYSKLAHLPPAEPDIAQLVAGFASARAKLDDPTYKAAVS